MPATLILSENDTRNLSSSLSNTTSTNDSNVNNNIGAKLLRQMGWTEGTGLGKHRQGIQNAVRAIQTSQENAGIGSITHGISSHLSVPHKESWNHVLHQLKHHHSNSSSSKESNDNTSAVDDNDDTITRNKKEKKTKKKKKKTSKSSNKEESKTIYKKSKTKKEEKNITKKSSQSTLILASNRVTAGHAQKMRHAKDLSQKTPQEMAAIWGIPLSTMTTH
jgi:site-specific DNA-cytosine methylase